MTVYGNALACLLVGFPLAYLFTFVGRGGLVGLWGAMAVAWCAATVFYSHVLYGTFGFGLCLAAAGGGGGSLCVGGTDWEAEVVAAAARNRRGEKHHRQEEARPEEGSVVKEVPSEEEELEPKKELMQTRRERPIVRSVSGESGARVSESRSMEVCTTHRALSVSQVYGERARTPLIMLEDGSIVTVTREGRR